MMISTILIIIGALFFLIGIVAVVATILKIVKKRKE